MMVIQSDMEVFIGMKRDNWTILLTDARTLIRRGCRCFWMLCWLMDVPQSVNKALGQTKSKT